MDKIKMRIGDSIGIMIPGIVLLINLYLLRYSQIKDSLKKICGLGGIADIKDDVILFLFFLTFSYIAGVVLRLLPPDIPDWWSGRLRLKVIWACGKRYIPLTKKHQARKEPIIDKSSCYYREQFPYFKWFYEDYIKSVPAIKEFYQYQYQLLMGTENANNQNNKHFDESQDNANDRNRVNFRRFLNYCKLEISNTGNDSALYTEVMFAEGLSRMASGMCFASFLSIIAIAVDRLLHFGSLNTMLLQLLNAIGPYSILLIANACILAVFLRGIRKIRVKEAVTVFQAYAIVVRSKTAGQVP